MRKIILKIDIVCFAGLYAGMNRTIYLETYATESESDKEKLISEAKNHVEMWYSNFNIIRIQRNSIRETQTILKNEI